LDKKEAIANRPQEHFPRPAEVGSVKNKT
jgi:hypothetical protein